MSDQNGSLQRSLTLPELIFYGVGTIVGAGIYSVIGVAAGQAGSGLWISFLLSAGAALLAALSYAELSSMFPKAGAEYQYIRAAFPHIRILPFVAGLLIALNAAATSATVAIAFGGYLKVFVEIPPLLTAFVLLALCTAVNVVGIRQSTWVTIALICIEVSGLIALIGGGFVAGDPLKAVAAPVASFDAAGIFAATALLFFMFIGFEDIANLSEEAKKPKRDIPRALLLSVVITAALYMLVCIAVLAMVSPEALAQSESPLTTAGKAVAPWLGTFLAITALFATASTALIALISISRLLFGMGRDGALPGFFAKLMPGRKTPWVAAVALFAAACALLPLGQVKTTASVSALGLLSVFVVVQAALIYLRLKRPALKRPFRIGGTVRGVPITAVAGLVVSLALITQFEGIVYLVFAGALAIGLGLYFIRRPGKA